jgi:hypothetical protein
MNVRYIFILYNSYEDFDRFLREQGSKLPVLSTEIYLVDNSENRRTDFTDRWHDDFGIEIIVPDRNAGYFGGAQAAVDSNRQAFMATDYTVVANVDLSFSLFDFTRVLGEISLASEIGVLAPCLITSDGAYSRQNHYFTKPTARSYRRLAAIYSNYYLAITHRILADIKKAFRKRTTMEPQKLEGVIYAPHGAMMVFTRQYINNTDIFSHPAFLFCEEIFVGHQCEVNNLRCVIEKRLRYTHSNHGSIGAIPSRKIVSFLRDAHRITAPLLLEPQSNK